MSKINVGAINGRRTVTFRVTHDGMVFRPGWSPEDMEYHGVAALHKLRAIIPAYEAFKRWKVARKAWHTRRRAKQQLLLKL